MVHLRLNTLESNPNPHINFITSLPADGQAATDSARELLRALAAQIKPVMKAHGFTVNSFEEYEYNNVFAGRNWNAGETIEIVLRRPGGSFAPISWLLSTLCHELAHIKHMNHGPGFQALWKQLNREVQELQRKGYYGDGFWSSGTRLGDFAEIGGLLAEVTDLPEYMCGGAQTKTRPARRRRRAQATGRPSQHTGAQTAKRRKAGSRVTASNAFGGDGHALNEGAVGDAKAAGTGFRKQAGSKRAREERANAIEKRLAALKAGPSKPSTSSAAEEDSETESDSDVEIVPETDQERRRSLRDALHEGDIDNLKSSRWDSEWADDFVLPTRAHGSSSGAWTATNGESGTSNGTSRGLREVQKTRDRDQEGDISGAEVTIERGSASSKPSTSRAPPKSKDGDVLGLGKLVETEMAYRKKEVLGLVGSASSQKLGTRTVPRPRPFSRSEPEGQWICQVCTLANEPVHLACAACATPKGQVTWSADQQ